MPKTIYHIEQKTLDADTIATLAGALDFYANPNNWRSDQDINQMTGEVTDYRDGRVSDDGGRAAAEALEILCMDEEKRITFSQVEYLKERAAKGRDK